MRPARFTLLCVRSQTTLPRKFGAAVAVALHALAAAALLSYEPARSALIAQAPILVDLIAPSKPGTTREQPIEVPAPRKPAAKPRPKLAEPLPIVAAPAEIPSPILARSPAREGAAEAALQPAAAVAHVAAPTPAPLTAPVFNADYLHNPPPAYPALSRRLGEEGRVILRVLVNAKGNADEVQVRNSSGHARLDEAARETVRAWRFVPARRGDEPVAAWVLIPIAFRLES